VKTKNFKGIILAGGSGTRLYPATMPVVKQLLPIYDKPMIYYPLSVLMLAGIRDILIISTPKDLPRFERLFGDGSQIGVNFSYKVQEKPRGLADAFLVGEEFLSGSPACLVLGDNIFFGHGLTEMLKHSIKVVTDENKAVIFGYYVRNPEQYGVIEFDKDDTVIGIEEKPEKPKSNYAAVGLYFYPGDVVEKAKKVKPSARGELEITTLNQMYLKENRLKVELMGRGFAWLDTGTFDSLLDASCFIQTVEKRQGLKIGCIEEIAYSNRWIGKEQLKKLAEPLMKSGYGEYLINLIRGKDSKRM